MTVTRPISLIALATLLALLAACSNNKSRTCSLAGGTQLASTAWPKFQADPVNSGRSPVDISGNDGTGVLLFPPEGQTIGSNQTTPIIGDQIIYVGSSDTNVYALQFNGQPADLEDNIMVTGAVTGSPLVGADGTLFVPTNGVLAQYKPNGEIKNNATLPGFAVASPNIWDGDGTAYVGTLSGGFLGVCPNGVQRYTLSFPSTQSPAAIAQDPQQPDESTPIIVAAGLAGQVRAYNIRGRQRWSFFASTTINAAVLIDVTTELFYVADSNGQVFAAQLINGARDTAFNFQADGPISASMALGRDGTDDPRLYVADETGTLYALDRATGAIRWTFQADGPIRSSPAVATGGDHDIIVFGADVLGTVSENSAPVPVDGRVYALRDDGAAGTLLWTFDAGASIGSSSPSINTDGTVYIGRAGQQMASGDQCPTGSVNPSATCTVNVGGALYAIGPAAGAAE